MLKFNQAERPPNDIWKESLYEEIELNGSVIGEMYTHSHLNNRFHAVIRLPSEMSLVQGHGDTRPEAVMNALQVTRVNLREFTDQFAVLSTQVTECVVIEPPKQTNISPDCCQRECPWCDYRPARRNAVDQLVAVTPESDPNATH